MFSSPLFIVTHFECMAISRTSMLMALFNALQVTDYIQTLITRVVWNSIHKLLLSRSLSPATLTPLFVSFNHKVYTYMHSHTHDIHVWTQHTIQTRFMHTTITSMHIHTGNVNKIIHKYLGGMIPRGHPQLQGAHFASLIHATSLGEMC